jgi:tyrosine-protein phosphatase SIW14
MKILRGTALLVFAGYGALCQPTWAAEATAAGVANFHHVNDRIFRGGQPDPQGWETLAKLGVKTVIDLRPAEEHSIKEEKQAVEATGMHYVNVPLNGLAAPPNDKISQLLALLNDAPGPVFVHCRRGADRTGTVIACYRVAHDGWSNKKALKEAKSDGMSWVEFGMQRYVMAFRASSPSSGQAIVAPPAQPALQPTIPPSSTLN